MREGKIVSIKNLEKIISILELPPPSSLIYCEILDQRFGFERCVNCEERIPCIRYKEAELTKRLEPDYKFGRRYFGREKEKAAMEKYFRSVGVTRGTKVIY